MSIGPPGRAPEGLFVVPMALALIAAAAAGAASGWVWHAVGLGDDEAPAEVEAAD